MAQHGESVQGIARNIHLLQPGTPADTPRPTPAVSWPWPNTPLRATAETSHPTNAAANKPPAGARFPAPWPPPPRALPRPGASVPRGSGQAPEPTAEEPPWQRWSPADPDLRRTLSAAAAEPPLDPRCRQRPRGRNARFPLRIRSRATPPAGPLPFCACFSVSSVTRSPRESVKRTLRMTC